MITIIILTTLLLVCMHVCCMYECIAIAIVLLIYKDLRDMFVLMCVLTFEYVCVSMYACMYWVSELVVLVFFFILFFVGIEPLVRRQSGVHRLQGKVRSG